MRARRKLQEQAGDRSHIPREERSYVEYHPRLLTHLGLTIVRQATDHHRRINSRNQYHGETGNRDSISSVASKPPSVNGQSRDHYLVAPRGSTPSESIGSNDATDIQRDDLYAFGQISSIRNVEPMPGNSSTGKPSGFEDVGLANDANGDSDTLEGEPAIDPALLADYDEIATPAAVRQALDKRLIRHQPPDSNPSSRKTSVSEQFPVLLDEINGTNSLNGRATSVRNNSITTSDRFLRSEVSVEEKYERLRREEGFSIGKLHEPSFRKIDGSISEHKVKLSSNAIAFGYQADRPFEQSMEAYTRGIELPESELADRVEYDMDEQDDYWLTQYNDRRAARDGDSISREIFEITLTKIEKEWTALEKRIPRPEKKEEAVSEDAKCAICDDGECENTNAIVFCDGCNLAVHQECYGVPYIPEGQWLCRKCFASPIEPVSCVFCPSKQGAFKQTSDLHWAHLLCTSWIPEVNVGNLVFMEPIEGVSNIPASRWRLLCYICKLRVGACIQCSNKACYTPFHVSCARQAKLFLQRDQTNLNAAPKSFCDKHVPDWYREVVDVKTSTQEAQRFFAAHTDAKTQSLTGGDVPSRGQFVVSLKKSKQNAVIPAVVFAEILSYMQKFRIRNKADFIADLCKYWSLKRRSRRGVSLLKRLQLQIEDNVAQRGDNRQRTERLDFSKALLTELDNYHRPLLEDLMEREIMKRERCQMRDAVIEHIYLPLQATLREALRSIDQSDAQQMLPQLSRAIERSSGLGSSVTWKIICEKVDAAEYLDLANFEVDLSKMVANVLELFPENSCREHRFINRLQERLTPILRGMSMREAALELNAGNKTASCFDQNFLPKGLVLTEEKPFNWALRDTSPLSDLDDDLVAELELIPEPPALARSPSSEVKWSSDARGRHVKNHVKVSIPFEVKRKQEEEMPSTGKRLVRPEIEENDNDALATVVPTSALPGRRLVSEPPKTPDPPTSGKKGRVSRPAKKTLAQEVLSKSVDRPTSTTTKESSVEISSPRLSRSAAREQAATAATPSSKRKREESGKYEVEESPLSIRRPRRH